MKNLILIFILLVTIITGCAPVGTVSSRDIKKDVLLKTTQGDMVLRLYDVTPQYRDNFIKLVKTKYYNGILFHRVIQNFMIQSGDPDSRNAARGKALGDGGPPYTIPAAFRQELFHKRGALASARDGDDVNPQKAGSGSQFYIVQGKKFTDAQLDTLEVKRLKRKIPDQQRQVYKTIGGAPHLDQNYTVFGELVQGYSVLDKIAAMPTSKGVDKDRPLTDVKILKAKMIKRKGNYRQP